MGQRLGAIHSGAQGNGAALRKASVGLMWPQISSKGALNRMRCGLFLVILAVLVGAAPALAQVRAPDKAPYPVETTVKHRAKRAVKKPPATTTSSYFHWSTTQPAAKPAPIKRRHARKPQVAKQTEAKTAPVPLPPRAPRAKIASVEPAKVEPAKTKPAPKKIEPAKTEPAKAAPAKIASITPEAPKAATAKPAPDAGALADIPAADRMKIEQELFWAGDYNGAAGGDDPMEAAIRKFQKRNKSKVTGVLTGEQRAELVAAADRHVREYGWRVVVDPATGIRIGLPTKLVPDGHEAARGTRWSSAHGEVQVETFRVKKTDLKTLYEHERKYPKTRNIERSTLNDDGFFISGMQGLKYFSVRAKLRDGEVRGFTMLYDQMMEGIVAPVLVAMASAFSPFPERPVPFAALEKKVEYGTGLIVSADGYIVTARRVAQACQVIVADGLGNAEHIAEDREHGLALLRVYGAGKLPALALPRAAATSGDITLIGIPDPKELGGRKKLTEIKARLLDGHAITLRQPVPMAGFSGAAALDDRGNFLGMMETRNFVLASADPGVPPVRLVSAAAMRKFLGKHHVALTDGKSGDVRAAAVRIICVRK